MLLENGGPIGMNQPEPESGGQFFVECTSRKT